ncbi:MAG: ribonuclease HI [Desulfobacteraceae bacterium]|nr:ribonuclease HI [Desulfobacteraceae bacterium]
MKIPENHPHWKRMQFKQNKVWIAVRSNNQLILDGHKALMKYQLNQSHQYWVNVSNLREIDDSSTAGPNKENTTTKKYKSLTDTKKDDSAIHIYTDGACSGNPGPAGIGVVMIYKDRKKEISRYIGIATNNIAELEAIRTGLTAITNHRLPIVVYTDSQYAFGLLTKGWKAKQNQELVQEVRKLSKKFTHLQYVKVKGHAGHEYNERADRLAVEAVEKGV